jgi:hypothetical protein
MGKVWNTLKTMSVGQQALLSKTYVSWIAAITLHLRQDKSGEGLEHFENYICWSTSTPFKDIGLLDCSNYPTPEAGQKSLGFCLFFWSVQHVFYITCMQQDSQYKKFKQL